MKEWKKWLAAGICCLCPWSAGAVDVQVRDVPTRTVLEGLARSGNINLVVDDSVQGSLTMNLHDVTLEEALQAIADSQGLYYEQSGPIRTMSGAKSGKGVKTFHTWSLRHADPAVLKEAARQRYRKPMCAAIAIRIPSLSAERTKSRRLSSPW